MTLRLAHRILIGTAIAFFAFYALWESLGTEGRGWRAVLALGAALALAIYFRTIGGPRPPGPRGEER